MNTAYIINKRCYEYYYNFYTNVIKIYYFVNSKLIVFFSQKYFGLFRRCMNVSLFCVLQSINIRLLPVHSTQGRPRSACCFKRRRQNQRLCFLCPWPRNHIELFWRNLWYYFDSLTYRKMWKRKRKFVLCIYITHRQYKWMTRWSWDSSNLVWTTTAIIYYSQEKKKKNY